MLTGNIHFNPKHAKATEIAKVYISYVNIVQEVGIILPKYLHVSVSSVEYKHRSIQMNMQGHSSPYSVNLSTNGYAYAVFNAGLCARTRFYPHSL